jgi:hypothetical protein
MGTYNTWRKRGSPKATQSMFRESANRIALIVAEFNACDTIYEILFSQFFCMVNICKEV